MEAGAEHGVSVKDGGNAGDDEDDDEDDESNVDAEEAGVLVMLNKAVSTEPDVKFKSPDESACN